MLFPSMTMSFIGETSCQKGKITVWMIIPRLNRIHNSGSSCFFVSGLSLFVFLL